MRNDGNSLSHTKWNCKYHYSVCAEISKKSNLWEAKSRYRGDSRRIAPLEAGEDGRGGTVSRSHSYVSENTVKNECVWVCGCSERESRLLIHERHGDLKYTYGNRSFWCRGHYVDTTEKSAKRIKEYRQNQLKGDQVSDQIALREFRDPFTGSE